MVVAVGVGRGDGAVIAPPLDQPLGVRSQCGVLGAWEVISFAFRFSAAAAASCAVAAGSY